MKKLNFTMFLKNKLSSFFRIAKKYKYSLLNPFKLIIIIKTYYSIRKSGSFPRSDEILYNKDSYNKKYIKPIERKITKHIQSFNATPLVTVILTAYNVDIQYFKKSIFSVISQFYQNWELYIYQYRLTERETNEALMELESLDSRIKIIYRKENGNISHFNNFDLDLARGKYIAIMDNTDEITADALYEVVKVINKHPDIDFIYSDEAKINEREDVCYPNFKPDFSPDMFFSQNYIGSFSVISKKIVDKVGGFRIEMQEAMAYDLFLKVLELTNRIYHIQKILYYKRIKKNSFGIEDKLIKKNEHRLDPYISSCNIARASEVLNNRRSFLNLLGVRPNGLSIIILNKNHPELIIDLLQNLLAQKLYFDQKNVKFEVIVGDTGTSDTDVLKYYKNLDVIVEYDLRYHFSNNNNYIAKNIAKYDTFLFLNNDIIFEKDDNQSLFSMYNVLKSDKNLGALGHVLLLKNELIQHIGIDFFHDDELRGLCYHPKKNTKLDKDFPYFKKVKAVTGAFLMINSNCFFESGGMDVGYSKECQDVDMCLSIRRLGYDIGLLNTGKIVHIENGTRPKGDEDWVDRQRFIRKWRSYIEGIIDE